MGVAIEDEEVLQHLLEISFDGQLVPRISLVEEAEGGYSFDIDAVGWQHPSEHEDVWEAYYHYSWCRDAIEVRFSPLAYKVLFGGCVRMSVEGVDEEMDKEGNSQIVFDSPQIGHVVNRWTTFVLPHNLDELVPDENLLKEVSFSIFTGRGIEYQRYEKEHRQHVPFSNDFVNYVSVSPEVGENSCKVIITLGEDDITILMLNHSDAEIDNVELTSEDDVVEYISDLYQVDYKLKWMIDDENRLRKSLNTLFEKDGYFLEKVEYYYRICAHNPSTNCNHNGMIGLSILPNNSERHMVFISLSSKEVELWMYDRELRERHVSTENTSEMLKIIRDHFRKFGTMKWRESDDDVLVKNIDHLRGLLYEIVRRFEKKKTM